MASFEIRRLVVSGRVQGVGYRAWFADRAQRRGLEGWVRNRRDGSVEALLAGPPDVVTDMVAECRRGPPLARVGTVDVTAADPALLGMRLRGELFSVLETA